METDKAWVYPLKLAEFKGLALKESSRLKKTPPCSWQKLLTLGEGLGSLSKSPRVAWTALEAEEKYC